MAKRNGWRVHGTDVSAYATEFASKRLGQNVFCGEIWDAGFNEQSFDVITLWHVLEHTTSPMRTLQEVRKVLKPGGLLALAVPNLNDRLMQAVYRIVKGRKLRLFSIGDKEIHLFHFSVRSLRLLLEKTGFTSVKIGPDFGVVEVIQATDQQCGRSAVLLDGSALVQLNSGFRAPGIAPEIFS